MITRSLYIFIINLVTYGGGGVFIPVYQTYYVDIFRLMSPAEYYNVISILNVIPGVTGGKLAGYAMYIEYGVLGMVLAIILFAGSGIMLVLILEKILSKVRDSRMFIRINRNIKPVVVGILLTITYDFYEVALQQIDIITVTAISAVTYYLLVKKQVKMYNLVVIYLLLSTIFTIITPYI